MTSENFDRASEVSVCPNGFLRLELWLTGLLTFSTGLSRLDERLDRFGRRSRESNSDMTDEYFERISGVLLRLSTDFGRLELELERRLSTDFGRLELELERRLSTDLERLKLERRLSADFGRSWPHSEQMPFRDPSDWS